MNENMMKYCDVCGRKLRASLTLVGYSFGDGSEQIGFRVKCPRKHWWNGHVDKILYVSPYYVTLDGDVEEYNNNE